MKGLIEVVDQSSGMVRTISFLEMAPEFDGYRVAADDLKMCYDNMKEFNQELPEQYPKTMGGLFTSAMGIGRAAALAAMDVFSSHLDQNPAMTDQDMRAILVNVRAKGRETGNPKFLASDQMFEEVVIACAQMKQAAQRSAQAAQEASPTEDESDDDNSTVTMLSNTVDHEERLPEPQPETGTHQTRQLELPEQEEDSYVLVEFDEEEMRADTPAPYETADEFSESDQISFISDRSDDASSKEALSTSIRLGNMRQDKQSFLERSERQNRSPLLPWGLVFPSLVGANITRDDPNPAWALRNVSEAKAYLDEPDLKEALKRQFLSLDQSRSVDGLPPELGRMRQEVDAFRNGNNFIMERINASLTLFNQVDAPEHEEFKKQVIEPTLNDLFNGRQHQPTLDRLM